jgi:hypothetical protein
MLWVHPQVVDQFVLNIALNSTCRISTKQNPIAYVCITLAHWPIIVYCHHKLQSTETKCGL